MFRSVKQNRVLILSTALVLITIEQAGVMTGWSSPVLLQLSSENSTIPTTNSEASWIATTLALANSIFTPFSALSLHYLGRKSTVVLAVFPIIISWIIISFAKTVTDLIISRVFSGIALSLIVTGTTVYLGEISPINLRGRIGLCITIVSNIGILWIYCVGVLPDLWLSSVLSGFPAVFVLIFYKWLPESPYFLYEKNRKEEAIYELKRLRQTDNVDDEIKSIDSILSEKIKQNSFIELFTKPRHLRALMICIGTCTFAQCTGGIAFLLYAHLIFAKAGNVSANLMSIIKAIFQLLSSVGSAYVVDNLGRRPLLIISCIGSSFFMACEGIYFYLLDNNYKVDNIWWLPLTAMILFNISQTIGLQSISFLYLGELFHPNVKSLSVCICKIYFALSVFIVGQFYQLITDIQGNSFPFFIFSLVGFIGIFFFIFFVPETKGKSFEEIHYYMKYKSYPNEVKLN